MINRIRPVVIITLTLICSILIISTSYGNKRESREGRRGDRALPTPAIHAPAASLDAPQQHFAGPARSAAPPGGIGCRARQVRGPKHRADRRALSPGDEHGALRHRARYRHGVLLPWDGAGALRAGSSRLRDGHRAVHHGGRAVDLPARAGLSARVCLVA